jgi:hypothetical protein
MDYQQNAQEKTAQTIKTSTVNQEIQSVTQSDVLNQILVELKIMNQYLYELPRLIAQGLPNTEEPYMYRIDVDKDKEFFDK